MTYLIGCDFLYLLNIVTVAANRIESYRAAGNKENGKKIIKPYEKPVYRDNCNHDLSILRIVIDL